MKKILAITAALTGVVALLAGSGCVARPPAEESSQEVTQERELLEAQKKRIVRRLNEMRHREQEQIRERLEAVASREPRTVRLQVDDEIEVEVWLRDMLQQQDGYPLEDTIPTDGRVVMPSIGEMNFLDRTPEELQQEIQSELDRLLNDPVVKVHVKKHVGAKVSILGEVQMNPNRDTGPGTYEIEGETLLSSFISEVGGYTDDADIRNIRVTYADGETEVMDLQRVLDGHIEENIFLTGGETVYIPEMSRRSHVIILGHIARPGVYPLDEGMMLSELIADAGGRDAQGTVSRVITVRGDQYHPEVIKSNLHRFYTRGEPEENLLLEPGDTIYVPKSFLTLYEQALRVILLPVSTVRDIYFLEDQIQDDD
ncbi:SLBB domain-containing protein [Kiritimatiella glycovorans]|uniref:Polysaccharide export protein Wza n=1 Tax=Kiritimatiella glycovorans TaxID=1307763 RepID=A0A0G3EGP5_9BACT|nr:SLBB domain-containing protein [Kiritimatiella glycovorans]AKJ64597.1 polysaccharide export protein Wza [Kiritimatiella glycovorans]